MKKIFSIAVVIMWMVQCGGTDEPKQKDPPPQVFEVIPPIITNKAPSHFLVKGADIKAGIRVQFKKEGGVGQIVVNDVKVESVNRIAGIAQPSAPAGIYQIILQNVDGQFGRMNTAITVVDDYPPEITGVAPDTISRDVESNLNIIGLRFPTDCTDCLVKFILEGSSTRELELSNIQFVSETKITATVAAQASPGFYRAEVTNNQGVKGEKEKALYIK
jgi:hypothetical protein